MRVSFAGLILCDEKLSAPSENAAAMALDVDEVEEV